MFQDLRYAVRLLLRSPGFTLFALLALGVGIGANVMVFSVLDAVLLRGLPAPQAERLVRVYEEWEPAWPYSLASAPNYLDWQKRNNTFSELAACRPKDLTLERSAGPERVKGAAVSPNYIRLLGVSPTVGRSFLANEDQIGSSHVVILSEGICRELYGSTENVTGRFIRLNAESYQVVGVMPYGFHFPDETIQLWIPLAFKESELANRGNRWLSVYGRLKPEVTMAQASQEMSRIAGNLAREYPKEQTGFGIRLTSLQEDMVGSERPGLLLLQAAVGCLLLIASINLANLLLSRSLNRWRELAIRASLGASRSRLVRQSLVESLVLGALGGVVGIGLASLGVGSFKLIAKSLLPRVSEISIDPGVLAFAVGLSISVGVLCGLAPSLAAPKQPQTGLRESLRGSIGSLGQGLLRNILVVSQIGGALVVLSCAGLLLRSFLNLRGSDPGIQYSERTLTATIALPPVRYQDDASVRTFYRVIQEKLNQSSEVKSSGAITFLPLTPGDCDISFQVVGQAPFAQGQQPVAQYRVVSGDYFQAAGIPLLAGRFFNQQDGPDSPHRILINRSLAARFWKTPLAALGNQIENEDGWSATIIGVVGDVHHFGLGVPVRDEYYYPLSQSPHYGVGGTSDALEMALVLRAKDGVNPGTLVPILHQIVNQTDSTVALSRVNVWSQLIADSIGNRRLDLWLVGAFALATMALSAIGLYSVISYGVTQRSREIAVRSALGASRLEIFRLILLRALRLVALGMIIGLFASFCVCGLLQSLLYGVTPVDPETLIGVSCMLLVISLFANYFPAQRAMRISPTTALREG
ncbi:MAG: ABC transporter permease [Verrucomicrobia bacterium]|nr:ABC transporter permease [Verrucomicrobiota bacterium]MBV8481840.1 ABC transporter permease [Verrucomicrobiota bacterium]